MISGLHLVTDERLARDRLLDVVGAAVTAGTAVVQVRAKHATARELTETVAAVSAVVSGRALVLVNDRVDVALAARHGGARVDGVHLGQDDLDPVAARALLGPDATVGWTANTPEHLAVAGALPPGTVDYLGVGLIHPTTSKADGPAVLGIEGFGAFARAAALPCIAIGGVRLEDVPGVMAAGAAGVAVVSAVSEAADPGGAAADLVAAIGGAR
ncbi:thiamine phosphate synthase [Aeromicrobium sp. 636]|uniref:Thiamine-phosphate synthase n=1 Tax=Aeromicrobium senzhongii TaxID=2663859 RepID=A0A8I0EX06_9ACTN|nr:thiamine phosphate synthase [Aeromicrobium sp. 636]MBC9226887.1 thiamine phosphate synthase [Aeromicrobium senzhongii]MCQ3998987.1 thiamine phosphate synthase [Aeromicrobium sp. 636]